MPWMIIIILIRQEQDKEQKLKHDGSSLGMVAGRQKIGGGKAEESKPRQLIPY